MMFFGSLYIVLRNEESWIWTIFGKNGKPIALLFCQNMMFFGSLYVVLEVEEKLNMDDFWQNSQAYSLTFWSKYGVFR